MIKPDQIPDEVVEAAKTTYTAEIYKGKASSREYHEAMREAIAAALNAWPLIKEHKVQVPDDSDEIRYTLKTTGIILSLPQEPSSD